MIQLKTLKWSNMFSYGENNVLHLDHYPITQLVGTNGNGKSSIALIIEEILFNSNSKKIKKGDILNRYAQGKTYSASLTFSIDNDEYEVVIKRGTTQTVKLIKNGEDISMHTATATYKLLEKLLPKSLSQLIYQRSSSSLEFLTATDTLRKRFLIELLNLEIYTKYFELFKELSKVSHEAVTSASGKIDNVQKWLDRLTKEDLSTLELLPIPEYIDYGPELYRLRQELANIETTNKAIIQNNQYKQMLDSIDLSILSQPLPELVSLDGPLKESAELTLLIKQDTDLCNKLSTLKNSCPTCLQGISEDFKQSLVSEATKRKTEREAILKRLTDEITEQRKITKLVGQQRGIQEEFEKLSRLYDPSKPKTLLDKADLQSQIADLSKKLSDLTTGINYATEENKKIISHNSKVATMLEQARLYREELEKLSASLNELKDTYNDMEMLKKVFSSTGFIAYKLENLVIELQNLTNEYLSTLSAGRFELNFEVENDKLNVVIIDNGEPIAIEALSSGELARVNTATLLAIRKLMSSMSKTKINLLILDETIDTLDVYGKEQLIEILLEEPELNTFIVSHGYTHPLLEKISIVKEKNISRLE